MLIALTSSLEARAASKAITEFSLSFPAAQPLTENYINIGDVKYHYVTAGQGPLLILYHGFPSFWYTWKYQIAQLARHYRVVAVDGLGSNLSDKPEAIERYHITRLVDDLNKLAYQLGGDSPFYLVGHDWGGALAWTFAQTHPQRLKKLVVLNAPPHNLLIELLKNNEEQQKASTYMDFLMHPVGEAILSFNDAYLIWNMGYQKHIDHHRISPAEGALFRQALAQPRALHSAINWYRANTNSPDSATSRWPVAAQKTSAESLLIWGQQDKAFVPEFLRQLSEYADNPEIHIIADAGHSPHLSHPQKVNRVILNFFSPAAE